MRRLDSSVCGKVAIQVMSTGTNVIYSRQVLLAKSVAMHQLTHVPNVNVWAVWRSLPAYSH